MKTSANMKVILLRIQWAAVIAMVLQGPLFAELQIYHATAPDIPATRELTIDDISMLIGGSLSGPDRQIDFQWWLVLVAHAREPLVMSALEKESQRGSEFEAQAQGALYLLGNKADERFQSLIGIFQNSDSQGRLNVVDVFAELVRSVVRDTGPSIRNSGTLSNLIFEFISLSHDCEPAVRVKLLEIIGNHPEIPSVLEELVKSASDSNLNVKAIAVSKIEQAAETGYVSALATRQVPAMLPRLLVDNDWETRLNSLYLASHFLDNALVREGLCQVAVDDPDARLRRMSYDMVKPSLSALKRFVLVASMSGDRDPTLRQQARREIAVSAANALLVSILFLASVVSIIINIKRRHASKIHGKQCQ